MDDEHIILEETSRLSNLSSNMISVGQKLLVVDNDSNFMNYYIVKKGDSLWSISKKFNTTVDELIKLNNLSTIMKNILTDYFNTNQTGGIVMLKLTDIPNIVSEGLLKDENKAILVTMENQYVIPQATFSQMYNQIITNVLQQYVSMMGTGNTNPPTEEVIPPVENEELPSIENEETSIVENETIITKTHLSIDNFLDRRFATRLRDIYREYKIDLNFFIN